MERTLYYGSEFIIIKPAFLKGNIHKDYDIVIGYRADDSYFHFPEAFVRSEIPLESLNSIFTAGELGKQYV